jgi:methylmalonyl-CoA mutase
LQEQDPYNNVIRTTYRGDGGGPGRHAVAAHQCAGRGHRAADRILGRIARNTQLVLQEETGITHVVDPLAGSYYVESLTQSWPKRPGR